MIKKEVASSRVGRARPTSLEQRVPHIAFIAVSVAHQLVQLRCLYLHSFRRVICGAATLPGDRHRLRACNKNWPPGSRPESVFGKVSCCHPVIHPCGWSGVIHEYIKQGGRADGRRTHGDRKEEHTEEHSDGHTRTSGSNTNMEQHGTRMDGRGTGHTSNRRGRRAHEVLTRQLRNSFAHDSMASE